MHAIYAYYLALNCTHHTTLGAAAVCRKCSHAACTLYWLMPRPQRAFAGFFSLQEKAGNNNARPQKKR